MDNETRALVEECEQRAAKAPKRTAANWLDFVADVVTGHEFVRGMKADVVECVVIEEHEAEFLEHAPADVASLCAKVRELDTRVQALTDVLEDIRDMQSVNDISDIYPRVTRLVGEPKTY